MEESRVVEAVLTCRGQLRMGPVDQSPVSADHRCAVHRTP